MEGPPFGKGMLLAGMVSVEAVLSESFRRPVPWKIKELLLVLETHMSFDTFPIRSGIKVLVEAMNKLSSSTKHPSSSARSLLAELRVQAVVC